MHLEKQYDEVDFILMHVNEFDYASFDLTHWSSH